MNIKKIKRIIKTKKELNNILIIANVDFGHVNPLITLLIGGSVKLKVDNNVELSVIKY